MDHTRPAITDRSKCLRRPKEFNIQLGVSSAQFNRLQRSDPDFPPKVQLGPNSIAYVDSDCDEYVEKLIARPITTSTRARKASEAARLKRLCFKDAENNSVDFTESLSKSKESSNSLKIETTFAANSPAVQS